MKNTIVTILQHRMDKCTNEQFWATGAITGLTAFLLSQNETICLFFSRWAILAVSTVICISGIFYVHSRHVGYYATRKAMAKLLQDEKNIPDFMTNKVNIWTACSLIGFTFYSGIIVVGWIGVIIVYF